MAIRPPTLEAVFWARVVAALGYVYFLGSILIGTILLLTTDSYCDYITSCSYVERHPYTFIGLPLLLSGMTFGAPMIAIGLYMKTQLRIQNHVLDGRPQA